MTTAAIPATRPAYVMRPAVDIYRAATHEADDGELDALTLYLRDRDAAALHAWMRQVLTVREARVLALRYGFDTSEPGPHTLDAAGQAMGIGRERARQLQEQALAKLRKAARERERKGAR